ncbi:MAG TPA: carbohydrate-binding family 9-like protein [Armatimonadota bacterium]|jgi:hypothetical protein
MSEQLPRGYVCCRAEAPIAIDGRLNKPAWGAAPWTADFRDIQGDLRPNPPLRTRAKMLWDDEYLYIGAEMDEPHVWATLTEHDSVVYQDPDFEVFIDPDGDNHEYYEIEINALNTEWDLRLVKPYRDGGPALNEWEIPGLKTAVHVDGTLNDPSDRDRGWSVELALPWTVLGEFANRPAPPAHGDQWRINFSRVEWHVEIVDGRYVKIPGRAEENWVWSPQGLIDMHQPERWGYVQFSTLPPGQDAFRRDPNERARDALMRLYHAQRAFQKANGRWAASLTELGLPADAAPEIGLTADGYKAALGAWRVRQDSRLWREG